MQILFLIGNGFDINLNMETKYTDFCKYYQSLETESQLLKDLKSDIITNIVTWADLEKRLGEYTENLKSVEEFDEVYEDLIDKLGDYLEDLETRIDLGLVNREKMYEYFCFPENSLPQADINIIKPYRNGWGNFETDVNIITFNYTRTIERLFDNNYKDVLIGRNSGNNKIFLRNIYHIHGYCDDGLIMGVNDISQIKNSNFHNDRRITNALVKTNNNKVQRHTIDEICAEKISEANLICVFGSSIGDSDNTWWELVGRQLLDEEDCKLIIFTSGNQLKKRFAYKKNRLEDDKLELFLNKTKLSEEEKSVISSKIFVSANTLMFRELLG